MKDFKNRIKFILLLMLSLIWMLVIFGLSSQEASDSNNLSKGVTQMILEFIDFVLPGVSLDAKIYNGVIRKIAHFTAYFILGLLSYSVLRQTKLKPGKEASYALLFCFLYAVVDETHQIFVPGRSGELRDVFIDTSGSGFGILFIIILHNLAKTYSGFLHKRQKKLL